MSEQNFVRNILVAWWPILAATVTVVAVSITIGIALGLPELPPRLQWAWFFLGFFFTLVVVFHWILSYQTEHTSLISRLAEAEDKLKEAESELLQKSRIEAEVEQKTEELDKKEKDLARRIARQQSAEEKYQEQLKSLQSAKHLARLDGHAKERRLLEIEERERKLKEDEKKLIELQTELDSYYLQLKQTDEEIYSRLGNLPEEKKKLENQIELYRCSITQLESELSERTIAKNAISSDLESFTGRYQALKAEIETLSGTRDTYYRELNELKIAQSSLQQEQAVLNERQSTLNSREEDLEKRERDLLELRETVESKDAEAQAKFLAAKELFQKTDAEHLKLRSFRERLWTNSFQDHGLSPSTQVLEEESQNRKCNAAMLLAYVHLLGTIQEHPPLAKEFNLLWPCLRGIGRFLVLYLQEQSESPESIVRSLNSWAAAMNEKSQAQFELWVPTIGESFKASSMDSQSGPIDSVSHVLNWAVSKSNSIMASKAEVS